MIDYTLKFPNEATANQVLEPFMATHNIDVIGVISKPTGEMAQSRQTHLGLSQSSTGQQSGLDRAITSTAPSHGSLISPLRLPNHMLQRLTQ